MPRYMHDVSLVFTVHSDDFNGEDITHEMVAISIDQKLENLGIRDLHEMILPTIHTEGNVMLTQEEWRRNPDLCPHCMRENTLEGGMVSVEGKKTYQVCKCTVCLGTFTSEYNVSRYNTHEH